MSENPYQAPSADVGDYQPALGAGNLLAQPRTVPAGRGASWFAEAWKLFVISPGLWIVFILVFFCISFGFQVVPIIGPLASYLIFPILSAGVAAACESLRRGEVMEFSQLFAGFSQQTGQLVLLGALYLAAFIAIGLIVVVPLVGMGAMGLLFGEAAEGSTVSLTVILVVLIAMALMIPVMMAYWFAPVLVFLHGIPAIDALKMSFFACLRNLLPFLVFGLVGLVVMILGMLPLFLGMLVVGPLLMMSPYVGYRDIFFDE